MAHSKIETTRTRAYNVAAKIICTMLPITCSQKSNAKWTIRDFFYGITAMCTANTYSESAMNGLAVQSDNSNPCGKWIRNCIQAGIRTTDDDAVRIVRRNGQYNRPSKGTGHV